VTFRSTFPALLTVALLPVPPAVADVERESPALHLEAGSVARHQIVAVGRDVAVEGSALAGVTALDGDARIVGEVAGDVVVVGGDVELAASGVVRGDVYVVGGELRAGSGSRIEGRSVAYPSVSRAWMTLLEGPSLGLSAFSPQVLAAKLALAAAWLALTLLLFAVGGRGVTTTSDEVRLEPWACFTAGLVAVLAVTTSALLLSALLPSLVAVPLLALVVFAATIAKLWGMVAVFHALGAALPFGRGRRRPLALHAAVVGLAVLAAIKLVPYFGLWAWTAASLVGIGAALRTKFGRREDWFAEALPSPRPLGSG
jgi:hypothetical protein